MIKRYIQSTIAMKYSLPMTSLALLIFIFSYLTIDKEMPQYKTVVVIVAIALTAVMISYYTKRFKVSRKLKQVKDIKEYDKAVMIGTSFMLEDRMLAYNSKLVRESNYQDITNLELIDEKGLYVIYTFSDQQELKLRVASKNQASRLAAFLLRKNPSVKLKNLQPMGEGALEHVESGVRQTK